MSKRPETVVGGEEQLQLPAFNLPHIDKKIIKWTVDELSDPGFESMKVSLIFDLIPEGTLDPRISTFVERQVDRMSQYLQSSEEESRDEAKKLLFREASLLVILILHQLSYNRGEAWHEKPDSPKWYTKLANLKQSFRFSNNNESDYLKWPIKFPRSVNYYDIPELRFSEEGFGAYQSQIEYDSVRNMDYFKTQIKEVVQWLKKDNRALLGFLRKRKRRLSIVSLTKHHYSPNKALELGQVSFEVNTRIIHLLSHIYRTNQLNQTLEAS